MVRITYRGDVPMSPKTIPIAIKSPIIVSFLRVAQAEIMICLFVIRLQNYTE